MQIFNNYSINFMATKKNITRSLGSNKSIKNPVETDFYNDINKFIKKDLTKEEYLNKFMSKVNNNLYSQLNNTEKKYVYDILTILDLDGSKKLSEAEMLEKMKKLIEEKK